MSARLAHEREAVRREREDPIDAALDPGLGRAEGGNQLLGPGPGLGEGVGREREDGRHDRRLARMEQVRRIDRQRDVPVAADREAVRVLAEVHVPVLHADVRMDRLEVGRDAHRDDLGKDGRPRQLMRERLERDRHPDHRPDPRTPDARRADHDVGRDLAAIREDRPDPAVVRPDVGDGVLAEERRATLHRAERLGLGDADRVGQAVGWHVIRTDDGVAIDERPQRRRLVGVDHPAGEAPRFGEVAPSVDLGQTFRRQSELQAADGVQTPPTVERQGPRLLDRIPGERGHRLRRIGLEDDPGCVRGGSAGLVTAAPVPRPSHPTTRAGPARPPASSRRSRLR